MHVCIYIHESYMGCVHFLLTLCLKMWLMGRCLVNLFSKHETTDFTYVFFINLVLWSNQFIIWILTLDWIRHVNYKSVSIFFSDNFFVDDYARFTVLDSQGKTAAIANSMNYLTKKGNPFLAYLGFSIFFFFFSICRSNWIFKCLLEIP